MKRTLLLLWLLLLVSACTSAALAASPYMSPYIFCKNYDDNVDYWLDEAYSDSMSAVERAEVAEAIKLGYTEEDGGIAYYNNPDWSIEASFYFENRAIDIYDEADAFNFVIVRDGFNDTGITLIKAIFLSTLTDLEQSIDANALSNWLMNANTAGDSFSLGAHTLYLYEVSDRLQYALF